MAQPSRSIRSAREDDEQPLDFASLTGGAGSAQSLDRLIHERMRLGIVSALAVAGTMTFSDLKAALGASDGNLSVHARRLEEAGYVSCHKFFEGRQPRTEYRLTLTGKTALTQYLDHMEALIQATRKG